MSLDPDSIFASVRIPDSADRSRPDTESVSADALQGESEEKAIVRERRRRMGLHTVEGTFPARVSRKRIDHRGGLIDAKSPQVSLVGSPEVKAGYRLGPTFSMTDQATDVIHVIEAFEVQLHPIAVRLQPCGKGGSMANRLDFSLSSEF